MPAREISYAQYWHAYLHAHSKPATRACHDVATAFGLTLLLAGLVTLTWWWVAVRLLGGYAIAIGSHYVVQGNRPLVHRPAWGIASDFRVIALALTGRLQDELQRHGVAPR